MTRTIDKEAFGCLLLIADAYGFHPTRAKWHEWEKSALEYERLDPRTVGWWLQQFTVETVTSDEAREMGAALTLALHGGERDPDAKAIQHPGFDECLRKFDAPAVRSSAQDLIDVCMQGAFRIDSSQQEYRAVLSSLPSA